MNPMFNPNNQKELQNFSQYPNPNSMNYGISIFLELI